MIAIEDLTSIALTRQSHSTILNTFQGMIIADTIVILVFLGMFGIG